MPVTREEALAALGRLNPAPVFLQSYRDQRLPESLEIFFGPPEELFLAPEWQSAYTEDRLIPLLDDGNFGLVTFHDPATGQLVQKDIESPDQVVATFASWPQFLADLMIDIAENTDDDEAIGRIAGLVGFDRLPELLAFLASSVGQDPRLYRGRRAAFVASFAPTSASP
jgi:hypothetical protein